MNEQEISVTRELTLQMIKIHDDAFERGFKSGKELLRQQNEELKNKLLAMRCEARKLADNLEGLEPGYVCIIARLRKLAE